MTNSFLITILHEIQLDPDPHWENSWILTKRRARRLVVPEPGQLLHDHLEPVLGRCPVQLTNADPLPVQVIYHLQTQLLGTALRSILVLILKIKRCKTYKIGHTKA